MMANQNKYKELHMSTKFNKILESNKNIAAFNPSIGFIFIERGVYKIAKNLHTVVLSLKSQINFDKKDPLDSKILSLSEKHAKKVKSEITENCFSAQFVAVKYSSIPYEFGVEVSDNMEKQGKKHNKKRGKKSKAK
jgi:hypothetical protein